MGGLGGARAGTGPAGTARGRAGSERAGEPTARSRGRRGQGDEGLPAEGTRGASGPGLAPPHHPEARAILVLLGCMPLGPWPCWAVTLLEGGPMGPPQPRAGGPRGAGSPVQGDEGRAHGGAPGWSGGVIGPVGATTAAGTGAPAKRQSAHSSGADSSAACSVSAGSAPRAGANRAPATVLGAWCDDPSARTRPPAWLSRRPSWPWPQASADPWSCRARCAGPVTSRQRVSGSASRLHTRRARRWADSGERGPRRDAAARLTGRTIGRAPP